MRSAWIALVLMISGTALGGTAPTRIKIATVPDEYTPTDTSMTEPVSMQDFRFEVNPETARARVVVEYTYPDQMVYSRNDDGGGPQPSKVQIPGLKYIPQDHAVVYEADGKETICARVEEHKGLRGHGLHIKNTGNCKVTAERAKHLADDGWEIQRFTAIDAYFEVH